jgi:multidrug efflux pump subunit AcrB
VLVSAAVSLTLVPMLCQPPAAKADTIDRRARRRAFIGRWFETPVQRAAQRLCMRTLDSRCGHRYIVLAAALGTFVLTGCALHHDSEGLLPGGRPGPDPRQHGSVGRHFLVTALQELQERVAAVIKADPNVQDVTSFVGGGNTLNSGRMFLVLKPRNQRQNMPQVLDSLRKATKKVPAFPSI